MYKSEIIESHSMIIVDKNVQFIKAIEITLSWEKVGTYETNCCNSFV